MVDAVGDGVAGLAVGERVAVNPNASCGRCGYCREGRPLLCDDLTGVGSSLPGGFAEYLVAPAVQVFPVEGLDDDTAVFTEPTSCAAHAVDVIAPRHGSTALVIGAGPTGILLAQLLRAAGAASVTVAAPTAFKLERAAALGADRTHLMDRGDLAGSVRGPDRPDRGGGLRPRSSTRRVRPPWPRCCCR